jgi:hypothetical protein
MKNINEIYKYLIDYLNEIRIEEYWDTPEDEGGLMLVNEVLFNGKNWFGFLLELDRILYYVKKDLDEFVDIDNISTSQIIEIEKIIDELASNLISRKSWKFQGNIEEDTIQLVYSHIADVVSRLHNHKNNWRVKLVTTLDQPMNLPIRWNENINMLVDIFYQLLCELKNGEKEPLVTTSKMNLANFIVNNFINESGLNLSLHSVYTILKDGRVEKRPKGEKRIQLKYIPI